MPVSLNDTCSVPERWKTCAMSTMFAPASRLAKRLGHPREREVDVAVGELLLRHDVDAALDDLDVEAPVVVEALLLRREVAGELRLDEPLQLQLHRDPVVVHSPPGPVAPLAAGRCRRHRRHRRCCTPRRTSDERQRAGDA